MVYAHTIIRLYNKQTTNLLGEGLVHVFVGQVQQDLIGWYFQGDSTIQPLSNSCCSKF